ncbi:hypothetical protein ANN_11471 [Periplaneta americana]|uniref:Uncharacterized protein n=1 Tax=Periplaneta americana TaxID=6978 RepID=A0ABQ8T7E6_PERAM|nr:hypothetical protein ANN_11471 [Periplaneta americana]
MHVGVFEPLMAAWKKAVHDCQIQQVANNEDTIFKKKDFSKLLHSVIDNAVPNDNLQSVFRKCRIFPCNPNTVDMNKMLPRAPSAQVIISTLQPDHGTESEFETERPSISAILESYLGEEKLSWNRDVRDTSLFDLWNFLKNLVE